MRLGRVEITRGFLLLAAVLNYLDRDGILLWTALACTLHEMGHYCMIYLCGGEVAYLRLSVSGAEMRLSAKRKMGHVAECLSAVAGPGVNLLSAYIGANMGQMWGENCYLFSGLSLSLAMFNLLPVRQLDGGRTLYHLVSALLGEYMGERVVALTSWLTLTVLVTAGVTQLWATGYNFTLLLTTVWLMISLVTLSTKKHGNYTQKRV